MVVSQLLRLTLDSTFVITGTCWDKQYFNPNSVAIDSGVNDGNCNIVVKTELRSQKHFKFLGLYMLKCTLPTAVITL